MGACLISSQRPRVFGYAGAPFLLSLPCLGLSVITARRIIQVSRTCPTLADPRKQISWLSRVSMNTGGQTDPKLPSRAVRRKRLSNLGLPSQMRAEKNCNQDIERRRLSKLSVSKSITSSMLDSLARTSATSKASLDDPEAHVSQPPSPSSPMSSVHSRSSTPSPIIFAAVRYNPQNPLLPPEPMALKHALSFDPGAGIEPHDVFGALPSLSRISASRERTSLELQDASMQEFHLPQRPGVGTPTLPTKVTVREMVDMNSKWTIQEEDETDHDVDVDEPPKCVVHRVLGSPAAFGEERRVGVMGLEDDPNIETARLPPLFTGLSSACVRSTVVVFG